MIPLRPDVRNAKYPKLLILGCVVWYKVESTLIHLLSNNLVPAPLARLFLVFASFGVRAVLFEERRCQTSRLRPLISQDEVGADIGKNRHMKHQKRRFLVSTVLVFGDGIEILGDVLRYPLGRVLWHLNFIAPPSTDFFQVSRLHLERSG
jgi:hypothetical protein